MKNVALDESSLAGLFSNWLDREWEARFLLDEQLRLLWNNSAADAWLDKADCPFRIQSGTFAAKDTRLQGKLAAMVASCCQETNRLMIGGPNGTKDLLFSARGLGQSDGYKCIGLSVRNIRDTDSHELVGFGDAFNLTPSEEAVLRRIMQGHNVEMIARNSRTSPETIRTHVRRAYSKMSVSSREEMFSRLKPFLFVR